MKLVINFDLFDAILNVNENMNCFKVIRNNKRKLILTSPICFSFGYLVHKKVFDSLLTLILLYIYGIGKTTFDYEHMGFDPYKNKSVKDLINSVNQLKEYLYLKTSFDLLKDSELIDRKYKIQFDKENILLLKESKYILIPTKDSFGNIKNVSLLQEHNIGSNEYVLSFGSPSKKLKFAYSSI